MPQNFSIEMTTFANISGLDSIVQYTVTKCVCFQLQKPLLGMVAHCAGIKIFLLLWSHAASQLPVFSSRWPHYTLTTLDPHP
jgi:hypothetical protein